MDDVEGVKMSESQCHILAKVQLDTATQRNGGIFQERSQTLVHQLHEEDRLVCSGLLAQSQILDNVWVFDTLEVLTLLVEVFLESCQSWLVMEDGVKDLSCARQLITLSSVNSCISTSPQLELMALLFNSCWPTRGTLSDSDILHGRRKQI